MASFEEHLYQKAIAHLAALFVGQLPIETQRAWRAELSALQVDPRDVTTAVRRLGCEIQGRIYLAALISNCHRAREERVAQERQKLELRQLPAKGHVDPVWNQAGMIVAKKVLNKQVRQEDFDREHRAEYDRLRGVG